MEADFSGYATKAGLKCSDGRTIMPEAFKHMDGKTVPLVWQHGHNDPSNVLGHALLEARKDGVYAYAFFNDTDPAKQAKMLVEHKDINSLSIYANQLVERSKQVFHGVIREVSLVLSGANPGALIDNVSIAHSDGSVDVLDDEAVIFTGEPLEHAQKTYTTKSTSVTTATVDGEIVSSRTSTNTSSETVDENGTDRSIAYGGIAHEDKKTVKDIYDSLTDEQKDVVHHMISVALESTDGVKHENNNEGDLNHNSEEGNDDMTHNVFEKDGAGAETHTLSHADVKGIVADAVKGGSLKAAVEAYALQHGIENLEILFPDAKALNTQPEFDKRRTEWVPGVINGTRHSPFSRVKTRHADLTHDEARAKGYIKGNLKKEEFFSLAQRTTGPTTVYKKQKLDRDDVIDITDFDVVAWMKAEMRMMLEEELARAILIGDGRDASDEDKIKDPVGAGDGLGIRSILHDHELYVATVNVNIDDSNSSMTEVVDQVISARRLYKGTGTPTFYTTEQYLTKMLLTRDLQGRRLWKTVEELASEMRVSSIVPVEAMEDETDLVGIMVNLADYNIGADKGGEVSLFDDFDIDYNQLKWLIETRVSGALTKIRSAVVFKKTAAANVLASPVRPDFEPSTNTITIPTTTGVDYKIDGTTQAAGAVVITEDTVVTAVAKSGYYLDNNVEDEFYYEFQA